MPWVGGFGLATTVAISMLPQTLLLQRSRKILAHVDHTDNDFPVDSHTQTLIQMVLQRILLKAEEEANIDFFICYGSDPIHKGSVKLKFGAIVGLPAMFTYRDVNQVEKKELLLDERSINWNSTDGQNLLEAIVLSDKAKAFVIAREINYANSYQLHLENVMRCGFGCLAYSSGFLLNKMFYFSQRMKPWARFSFYSVVASTWFLLYLTIMDTYYCWQDNAVDKKTAHLTRTYAEGGVEYYEKLLARNRALRSIMGSEGQRKITPFGNIVSTWRRSHVQLTTRRDNLQMYLKNYELS